jgi:hypothetical protein
VSSVDELVASIAVAERLLDQVDAAFAATCERFEELHGQVSAIGVESTMSALAAIRSGLAEQWSTITAIRRALEQARAHVEAARGGAGTSSTPKAGAAPGSGGVPKPTSSHGAQQKRAGIKAGLVKFAIPRRLEGKLTPEHQRQVQEYIDAANQALTDGKLSGKGRVRPSRDPKLKNAKDAAAAKERARAEAAGTPYGDKVAAHLPDTTWSGTADPPGGWGRHDATINASLGSQSDKYPEGYQPERFELDGNWTSVDAEGGEGE